MTNISHDLAGKIDEQTVAILTEIGTVARDLTLPFFIVGATARDILLQHAFEIHVMRATVDIDVGVFVSDWSQFEALKQALLNTGKFNSSRQTQRLMYEDEFPVDIVPFGGIAAPDGSISWPPGYDIEMSVVGFRECFEHAISVKVSANPALIVKVVNLAGLAIMKIVSWDDSTERRGKDAADLFVIMKNYIEAGQLERFFEEEGDILAAEKSDYDRASARFLGREIARMADPDTKAKLINILERGAGSSQGHRIAIDVLRKDPFQNEPYEKIAANFDALLSGMLEVSLQGSVEPQGHISARSQRNGRL
jgi:predicted nucleotidyltransferase